MKVVFDRVSHRCSRQVTHQYTTSFSIAITLLGKSIRQDIYNIYGFVRLADEVVDSFQGFDQKRLFDQLETELHQAVENRISTNPILNAFQETVWKYQIQRETYEAFMQSMRQDLVKKEYATREELENYIYGSADAVGLMCLRVFVRGDSEKYEALKGYAMKLGSAFQKVNFLRDMKSDYEALNRVYFPGIKSNCLDESAKREIIEDIETEFAQALKGIHQLPTEAKAGVYTAYLYYRKLLKKLRNTPPLEISQKRIRVPNYQKAGLLARSYIAYRLKWI